MSSVRRIAPRSSGSSAPKTTRMITSSVSACMRGWVANGGAARPALDLGRRELRDQVTVRAHAVAVERRQHQLALAQVRRAVEDEDRVGADERLEEARALAGRQHVRRGGEHRADVGGVGDDHHRRVGPRGAERERDAEAGGAAAQQHGRPRQPLPGLEGGRGGRAGRQHRPGTLRRARVQHAARRWPPRRGTSPPSWRARMESSCRSSAVGRKGSATASPPSSATAASSEPSTSATSTAWSAAASARSCPAERLPSSTPRRTSAAASAGVAARMTTSSAVSAAAMRARSGVPRLAARRGRRAVAVRCS